MYVAINRFSVRAGQEEVFERIWRERDSYLSEVPGFREFHLLRGETQDDVTVYLSHSTWEAREAFEDWTRSDAFRKAHGQARSPEGTVLGHPRFEGYAKVL